MKKKGEKSMVRNGKVYVGAWIKKEVVSKSKQMAQLDSRTLSSYIEVALSFHNERDI